MSFEARWIASFVILVLCSVWVSDWVAWVVVTALPAIVFSMLIALASYAIFPNDG